MLNARARFRLVLLIAPLALSSCMSDNGDDLAAAALQIAANKDHAHCTSLLMRPGDLVYAQCRLALRKTYLNNYADRKTQLQAQAGVLPNELDMALRNDAFCNYDESVKAAMTAVDENAAAYSAYAACETSRQQLQTAIFEQAGLDGIQYTQIEQPMVIQQNIEAVRETKAVVNGPYV